MNINEAIAAAKKNVKDINARAYLRAIPDSIEMGGTNGLSVQILYALNNMASWRGDIAREAKKVMKDFTKNLDS